MTYSHDIKRTFRLSARADRAIDLIVLKLKTIKHDGASKPVNAISRDEVVCVALEAVFLDFLKLGQQSVLWRYFFDLEHPLNKKPPQQSR